MQQNTPKDGLINMYRTCNIFMHGIMYKICRIICQEETAIPKNNIVRNLILKRIYREKNILLSASTGRGKHIIGGKRREQQVDSWLGRHFRPERSGGFRPVKRLKLLALLPGLKSLTVISLPVCNTPLTLVGSDGKSLDGESDESRRRGSGTSSNLFRITRVWGEGTERKEYGILL